MKNPKERHSEMGKKQQELDGIMSSLTAMCLEDIKSRVQRMKIETLVTVHVHQIDIFKEIKDEA